MGTFHKFIAVFKENTYVQGHIEQPGSGDGGRADLQVSGRVV